MSSGGINSLFFTDPDATTRIEYFARVTDDKVYGIGGQGVFVGNIAEGGKTYYFQPVHIIYETPVTAPGYTSKIAIIMGDLIIEGVPCKIAVTLQLYNTTARGMFTVYHADDLTMIVDSSPMLPWENPHMLEHLVIKKPT